MSQYKSDFISKLVERQYLHQCTDIEALDAKAAGGPVTAYIGFDCTAPSLHVGSLVPIMLLRLFQQTGHKPIVLMGGGTTKVGDPSGKDDQRKLLDDAAIAANMAGIKSVFEKFLTFGDGPKDAVMVNNANWLENLNYVSFLRDYGRHFTINRMLSFDSVKLRLDREQPLTFLEFNYMILQAYDFLELANRHSVSLQMGGSDQWGNIINGVELGRRVAEKQLYGLTTPLLTTASGAKMGKTADGAVWLNEDALSAYDYWQYWRNCEDADVGRFLRLFTEMPIEEIERLEKLEGAEINDAKKTLADEATRLCRGDKAAELARSTAETTFEQGGMGENLPSVDIARAELDAGIGVLVAFTMAGLSTSNGEARRLIRGGGAKVNDQAVSDEKATISSEQINSDGVIKLSAGKKRHALIKPV
ncbi:MAG: tyrosine--tRNA ligase [Rhodospirillales bacterium]